jgi:septum formation protein
LTLASGSAVRKTLLENAGIACVARPARIDEDAIRISLTSDGAGPRDIADALAEFKARKVAERGDGGLTLGCDQILALKSEIFRKADTRDAAFEKLQRLRGQTHHLYSAAVIYDGSEPVWRHVGIARMTMAHLTDNAIDAYLDLAWPDVQDAVGAYHAEGIGVRLFSRIDGDWFSVLGLPLLDICSYLRLRGWTFR